MITVQMKGIIHGEFRGITGQMAESPEAKTLSLVLCRQAGSPLGAPEKIQGKKGRCGLHVCYMHSAGTSGGMCI